MKNLIKVLAVTLVSIFTMSFLINGNLKNDEIKVKPTGTKQVFMNTGKFIKSNKNELSPNCFKSKLNDSLHEGFRMYTFDFDNKNISLTYLTEEDNGKIKRNEVVFKFDLVNADADFALLKIQDTTNYYNKVKEKFFIINLKDNPNYPILQNVWLDNGVTNGIYSVDTRDFVEMVNDTKENIFDK
jgi:hypothetical protein